MSIGHDCMGIIVQPASCSLALFFASGVAWQLFGFLALWCFWQIFWQRYLHLRAVRRIYHTTNRLDTDVLFWWGFPLSMLLAGSAFWCVRLRSWPLLLVPAAWAVGLAVWVILLAFVVRPLSLPKEEGHACHRLSYDEVRAQRFYDWHNCNPIKVLLSHCDEGTTRAIPPFQIGKEYLQALEPSWRDRMRKANYHIEAYCSTGHDENPSFFWRRARNLQVPEVETFVQRPLETVLGFMTRKPSRSNTEHTKTPDRTQKRIPPGAPRARARNVAGSKATSRAAHSARSPPTRRTPKEEDTPVSQAQSVAAVVPDTADKQGAAPATASANGADSGAGPLCQTPRPRCKSDPESSLDDMGLPIIDFAMGVEGLDNSPSTRGHGKYL